MALKSQQMAEWSWSSALGTHPLNWRRTELSVRPWGSSPHMAEYARIFTYRRKNHGYLLWELIFQIGEGRSQV